ncbi:MAG: DUF6922 domain-containing protein [Emticicia sp.]|uniref:DUF6922 domain-containing protein n=1 Tax=Emticicia sp. TaxID=1930953 RepID=UPI003BA830E2
MEKPNLSKQAFWDVDFDSLDYEKEANWIIGRVFEWGKLSDLKNLLEFYGHKKCKDALLKAPFLRLNAISLGHLLLDIPKNKFKCYINRPSHIPF